MLRITRLRNKYQKRLIRPLYAQTQATPYAAVLGDNVNTAKNTSVWTGVGSGAPFTYKGGLVPGTVMVAKGEAVDVASSAAAGAAQRHFGLLANFVGGELDDLGDEKYVGVWRGPDSVYEILAPGFNDTGLQAAWNASTVGVPVPLYADATGLLSVVGNLSGGVANSRQVIAYLIERPNENRIVVDLVV
jgi:hypothetical protein